MSSIQKQQQEKLAGEEEIRPGDQGDTLGAGRELEMEREVTRRQDSGTRAKRIVCLESQAILESSPGRKGGALTLQW